MTKYEYRIEILDIGDLNELGREGWEVVAPLYPEKRVGGVVVHSVLLKREIREVVGAS
jgi:hypothetical protein